MDVINVRTRTRGVVSVPYSIDEQTIDRTCSSGTEHVYRAGPYIGTYETMQDASTPGFAAKQRAGFTTVSSLLKTSETFSVSGQYGRVKIKYPGPSCSSPVKYKIVDITGPFGMTYHLGASSSYKMPKESLLSASEISSAVSVAATQAWSGANNHSADTLQDIAEMRQTINMVRNPLGSGVGLLKKIWKSALAKNKPLRKKPQFIRGFSSTLQNPKGIISDSASWAESMWLQYRFGVRPLISSVDGVLKALQDKKEFRRWTSRGSYTTIKRSESTGETTYSPMMMRHTWKKTVTDEVRIRCGILMESQTTLPQAVGLDASGMLALPWQLLPYSFVADWFANVGTYLGSVVPYITVRPLQTWHTIERIRTVTYQVTGGYIPVPANAEMLRQPQETWVARYVDKTRASGIPGPAITWKPGAIDAVLTDLRLVDGLALVSQFISRLSK